MPRFSVCINAYNEEENIERTINSVLEQDFSDFELLVVDDASTDSTPEIIRTLEKRDSRVKGVFLEKNLKRYLSKRKIVEMCQSDYTLILDADDEMQSGLLRRLDTALAVNDVDMFHFGLRVRSRGVDEEQCRAFEDYCNSNVGYLEADEIMNAIFGGGGEFLQDWQLPQRAFRTKVLQKAFSLMVEERLDSAEDAYEMFVICAIARSQATNNEIKGLIYNYGAGLNGRSEWSKDKFVSVARDFAKCINEIDVFASDVNKDVLTRNAKSARPKLLDLLFNDWHTRVADENKIEAARTCLEIFEENEVAAQIARCIRDDAYSALTQGKSIKDCPVIEEWFKFVEGLDAKDNVFYAVAKQHVEDLTKRASLSKFNDQKELRIFVSCHKEVELFDSEILQPVQVGASNSAWRFPWALQDDAGESISDLNPMYCELTAQYWAWKNVDCERYGFCHYRRYFNFANEEFKENPFGEIIESRIDPMTQERFGLVDDNILKEIKDYDIVTTKFQDLRRFPGKFSTPLEHWHSAPNLHDKDLDSMVEILKEMHPDYSQACDAYLNGHKTCFCNMFVMTKEIFNDYCPWLFGILEEFCKRADFTNYSNEALRTAGHLAERLLNIYILKHKMDDTNWKHKQVQCVHFEKPEKVVFPLPDFHSSALGKRTVPVVFAADNNYVPVLTTAIYSMCENANLDFRYDIAVLNNNISWDNQVLMKQSLASFKNVSLRFFNVDLLIEGYKLTTSNPHISNETYYRFLIQEVLPEYDKVVYLDSDMVVEGDVSEIFNVDLGNDLIAAVKDIDFLGNLNFKNNERIEYNKNILGMSDPHNYFQAGTLVLNTKGLRELHTTQEWMEFACDSSLIYNDQDILNRECEGRVTYLPMEWNVMHNCGGRIERVFTYAPAQEFENYFASRNNPKIIHFAGFEKPWTFAEVDLQEHFWKYARETVFYETLLGKRSPVVVTNLDERMERHQRVYHPVLYVAAKALRKLRARG